jgi:hypothetical protein
MCQATAEPNSVIAVPEKKRLVANQRNGASRNTAKRDSEPSPVSSAGDIARA